MLGLDAWALSDHSGLHDGTSGDAQVPCRCSADIDHLGKK